MKKRYYIPDGDYEREVWLNTLYAGVAGLPKAWNISEDQLTSLLNDRDAYRYSLVYQEVAIAFSEACTSCKDLLKRGLISPHPQLFPVFEPPDGMPTIAVHPGIFTRVANLVSKLKLNDLYNEAIGKMLGVIGAEIVVDYSILQPELRLTDISGYIHIRYIRGATEGIILYCMRGAETTFTLLATITKTTYNDTRPNLIDGQAEKRQYRAFFMVSDVAVGIESSLVNINC